MSDTEFLVQLAKDLETAAWDSTAIERLYKVIQNLQTLEQGYKVIPDPAKEWEGRGE